MRNWCKRFGTFRRLIYYLSITHRRLSKDGYQKKGRNMCVRTLFGTESSGPVVVYNNQNKLQKAKEKYMKLHDDLVTKELEMLKQRKTQTVFIPELADDILRASTINYSSLLKALSNYYESIQQTKIFK